MLQLVNDTPHPSSLGLFTDHQGHQTASVVLKATLAIPGDEDIGRPAPRQLPVLSEPSDIGPPGRSSVRDPADLVPTNPPLALIDSAFLLEVVTDCGAGITQQT